MTKTLNILMLGGAKRVSVAQLLKEAGAKEGVQVNIFSHELSTQEPIASVGTIIPGGKYSSPGIDDEIDSIITEYGINIILPFIDPAIAVASRAKSRHNDVFVPVSPERTATAMFDKVEANKVFCAAEFPIPKSYTGDSIKYPAILKPRFGSASKGIIVANCANDIKGITNFNDYLIQEYIANRDEYTVDCYVGATDGAVKSITPRLRIATAGGEVIRTETKRDARIIEASEKVLSNIKFYGPVTLQFMFDRSTDRYLLMEINPRLGGGVVCSILAGAPIVSYIIKEALGQSVERDDTWRDHTLMARYFKEVMFYND